MHGNLPRRTLFLSIPFLGTFGSYAFTRTEIAAAGAPLCEQPSEGKECPSVKGGTFPIKAGGAMVTARAAFDDFGTMKIKDSGGNVVLTVSGGVDDWHRTKDPSHWHGSASAFLPEGTYSVTAAVTNKDMGSSNVNNLAYFRFEVVAAYVVPIDDDDDDDKEEEPRVCKLCGCSGENGDDANPPADDAPGSSDEDCGSGSIVSSGNGGGAETASLLSAEDSGDGSGVDSGSASAPAALRYDSVWAWSAQAQDGVLTIRPSSGRRMRFAVAEGSSVALPVSLTRHCDVRVELQDADLVPCASGSPAF